VTKTDLIRFRQLDIDPRDGLQLIVLIPGNPGVSTPWIVASYNLQPYGFQDDDTTTILATPGTVFAATNDHTILVKEGSVVVVAGGTGTTIQTAYGTAFVAANTSSGITVSHFGDVKVASLEGDATQVDLAYKGNSAKVLVADNSELSISPNQIATAGASDYVTGPDATKSPVSGLSTNTGELDLETAPYWGRLNCIDESALTGSMVGRINQVRKAIKDSGKKLPATCIEYQLHGFSGAQVHLRAIGMVTPTVEAVKKYEMVSTSIDGSPVYYMGETPSMHNGKMVVSNSHILIDAAHPAVISAGTAEVHVGHGAVAVIEERAGVSKVRNLCDNGGNSVVVNVGGNHITLLPGQEVITGGSETATMRAMTSDKVARRRMKMGGAMISAEFSLLSLVREDALVKEVLRHKTGDDVRDRVLKMAACLYTATAGRGSYESVAGH